jgi:hypothetical protein
MIECPKCGYDNDLGRIFCAKCGDKLEISRVKAPSRIRHRGRGKGATSMQTTLMLMGGNFVRIIVLACIAALLTAIALPPKFERLDITEADLASFQEKKTQVSDAVDNQQEVKMMFTESEVNASMADSVKETTKKAQSNRPVLDSVYIQFREGDALLTAQNKWKWFRLGVQVLSEPKNVSEKWTFTPKVIWIGRLHIPQQLNATIVDVFLSKILNFDSERQILNQMSAISIKPGQLSLVSKKSE